MPARNPYSREPWRGSVQQLRGPRRGLADPFLAVGELGVKFDHRFLKLLKRVAKLSETWERARGHRRSVFNGELEQYAVRRDEWLREQVRAGTDPAAIERFAEQPPDVELAKLVENAATVELELANSELDAYIKRNYESVHARLAEVHDALLKQPDTDSLSEFRAWEQRRAEGIPAIVECERALRRRLITNREEEKQYVRDKGGIVQDDKLQDLKQQLAERDARRAGKGDLQLEGAVAGPRAAEVEQRLAAGLGS